MASCFSLGYNAFFLECADSLRAELHGNFFAVHYKCLGLKVWLPDFLGMALRKAHVVAVLLSFAGKVASLHGNSSLFIPLVTLLKEGRFSG